jgi:hypothetical protein
VPAVSKAQFRFMEAIKHGGKKKGLSPEKAAEYIDSVNYKKLPAKKIVKKMLMKK